MKDFSRVLRPGAVEVWKSSGKGSAPLFLKVEYKEGRLSISGVEGPRTNGDAWGSCGQCVDSLDPSRLRELAPGWTRETVKRLRETCARLGYTIPDACADGCKRGCSHDGKRERCPVCLNIVCCGHPVAPPTPYTVKRERGASVVYDANGGAVTGPINGEAALLLAAAPEMAEALKAAEKIIKTARQYFPKSIKNPDRFALELAAAEIGKALHRTQEAR